MARKPPKTKIVEGIKWVTITQVELEPRKTEWAACEWGACRVEQRDDEKTWSIAHIHQRQQEGFKTADEAMVAAIPMVKEKALARLNAAQQRKAPKRQIKEIERRCKAVGALI